FYGLRAVDSPGSEAPPRTIEEMAAQYVQEIKAVQIEGPFLIGGFSLGGVVAFEMACQLRAAGQGVALLAVIDASLPAARPTEPGEPDADDAVKLIGQLARLWQW